MKLAVNQATLMKTPMDVFLKTISEAGFEGVELRRDQTFEYLKDHSIADLKTLLSKYKLKCITFNAIELFSLCSKEEFQKMLDYTEKLMKIGNRIGCDTIIAVPSFFEGQPIKESSIISQTVERLKILAKLAETYTFKLAFEPLGPPNNSVRKIDLALKIIRTKGLPPMGLVIDTFHYFVGEHTVNDIGHVDPREIWLIHVNDCLKKPIDVLKDSDRVLPGQGFFDLKGFVTKLKLIKYDGWLSLELFNEKLWEENPITVAKNSFESLKKLL